MNSDDQITVWDWPFTQFASEYGMVSYLEWCQNEIERIAATGASAEIIAGEGVHAGMISLIKKAGGDVRGF